MRYTDYDIIDFLSDEFFIQWVKRPDKNTRHFWEKWMQQHPEKRETVLEAASIIRSVKYAHSIGLSDEMYVETFETIIKAGNQKSGNEPKIESWFSFYPLRNIAAIAILCFCGWMVHYHMIVGVEPVKPVLTEEITVFRSVPPGKRSVITLADSSRVYLNSGSEIEYPKAFSQGVRWVRLKGEAFFEVRKNGHSFSVFARSTEIKVLGTSFNVKEDKTNLSIALLSGKVQVNDQKGNQVQLNPAEMLEIEGDGKFSKTGFDPLEVTGWKDKILVFRSASFEDVKVKIENWYGVDLKLMGKVSENWKYSGMYKDENLENVLRGICITSGLRYKIANRNITIYNPN
ncbi:FecR family protein [Cyclobacterium sp.]|uniref:FecR family protein n=1 Tax=Cyclobacterium sp. TaxID=1966343 RepID=UPI0019BB9CFF|nr:FecR family protein [Cyclobacterium sp.]MBD3630020.1 FecR domain-containing protein [Cyclobacterium sp.]